jgi:hypothetical protein
VRADEVLWYSQRDGWGHLYRYDLRTGDLLGQLTSGQWAVRQILHVDEAERVVYFTAAGLIDVDPYRRTVCRVGGGGPERRRRTRAKRRHGRRIDREVREDGWCDDRPDQSREAEKRQGDDKGASTDARDSRCISASDTHDDERHDERNHCHANRVHEERAEWLDDRHDTFDRR